LSLGRTTTATPADTASGGGDAASVHGLFSPARQGGGATGNSEILGVKNTMAGGAGGHRSTSSMYGVRTAMVSVVSTGAATWPCADCVVSCSCLSQSLFFPLPLPLHLLIFTDASSVALFTLLWDVLFNRRIPYDRKLRGSVKHTWQLSPKAFHTVEIFNLIEVFLPVSEYVNIIQIVPVRPQNVTVQSVRAVRTEV
jgi:hypothetical protein